MLFLSFWYSVFILLGGMIYFRFYLEGVFLMLLADLLYGIPLDRHFGITYVYLISTIILIVIIEMFKKGLKVLP